MDDHLLQSAAALVGTLDGLGLNRAEVLSLYLGDSSFCDYGLTVEQVAGSIEYLAEAPTVQHLEGGGLPPTWLKLLIVVLGLQGLQGVDSAAACEKVPVTSALFRQTRGQCLASLPTAIQSTFSYRDVSQDLLPVAKTAFTKKCNNFVKMAETCAVPTPAQVSTPSASTPTHVSTPSASKPTETSMPTASTPTETPMPTASTPMEMPMPTATPTPTARAKAVWEVAAEAKGAFHQYQDLKAMFSGAAREASKFVPASEDTLQAAFAGAAKFGAVFGPQDVLNNAQAFKNGFLQYGYPGLIVVAMIIGLSSALAVTYAVRNPEDAKTFLAYFARKAVRNEAAATGVTTHQAAVQIANATFGQCAAISQRTGARCGNKAIGGTDRCYIASHKHNPLQGGMYRSAANEDDMRSLAKLNSAFAAHVAARSGPNGCLTGGAKGDCGPVSITVLMSCLVMVIYVYSRGAYVSQEAFMNLVMDNIDYANVNAAHLYDGSGNDAASDVAKRVRSTIEYFWNLIMAYKIAGGYDEIGLLSLFGTGPDGSGGENRKISMLTRLKDDAVTFKLMYDYTQPLLNTSQWLLYALLSRAGWLLSAFLYPAALALCDYVVADAARMTVSATSSAMGIVMAALVGMVGIAARQQAAPVLALDSATAQPQAPAPVLAAAPAPAPVLAPRPVLAPTPVVRRAAKNPARHAAILADIAREAAARENLARERAARAAR